MSERAKPRVKRDDEYKLANAVYLLCAAIEEADPAKRREYVGSARDVALRVNNRALAKVLGVTTDNVLIDSDPMPPALKVDEEIAAVRAEREKLEGGE